VKSTKIYQFLIPSLFLTFSSLGQCPKQNVVLSSQQQVNEFATVYKNCTAIYGNVTIGTAFGLTDIHDLSPMAGVRTIEGYLNISNNPGLSSLHGLEDLISVNGYLNIFNNDRLTTLDGLSGLVSVHGFLWIIHNENLISPKGLNGLTSINGSIEISDNPSLTSLEGLEQIDPGTIFPTQSYLLSPIIDVKIFENGNPSIPRPPNIDQYFENNNLVHRFQNMIHKSYVERAVETDMLYKGVAGLTDSVLAKTILREIAAIAQNSGQNDLIWESDLLSAFYQLNHAATPMTHRIEQMQAIADRAGREEKWHIQARALRFISIRYWHALQEYEKTFKTNHALAEVISKIDPEEFPDLAECYRTIGAAHYFFRDYREAIRFFRKGASIPQTPYNASYVTHCINNLGLSYQKLHIPDSSDYQFNQILLDSTQYAIEVWKGIASGNLGNNYYLRKEYDRAIPLLKRDVSTAESLNLWGLAAGSLIPLADIQLSYGRLTETEKLIQRATDYIRLSGESDRLRLLFPVISKWHSVMGNQKLASDYVDSTVHAIAVYNEKFNALKVLRAKLELSAQELRMKEIEKQKLLLQRNLIMAIVLIVFFFGMIFIKNFRTNLRRKRAIQELALINAQESLDHAQTRLGDLTRKIRENNQIIHRLKQNNDKSMDLEALEELQNATILTQEDWRHFKNLFQTVYPGFIDILKSRYSDLTSAELRCLCLEKLQLTNPEMAAAQGVSPKSINVTQYRIRKKLGLENQSELEQLVNSVI